MKISSMNYSFNHNTLRRLTKIFGTCTTFRRFSQSYSLNNDAMVTSLNCAKDISVKVLSCKNVVDRCMLNHTMSVTAGRALSELILCTAMMGSGLKGKESLQVNIVGNGGLRNMIAISDGELSIRARVDQPQCEFPSPVTVVDERCANASELFGDGGQVQVIRHHPAWKSPMTGVVELRSTSIADNMALYMGESEQRLAAILTCVKIVNNKCEYALGVMVERLPNVSSQDGDAVGGDDESDHVEISIRNLQAVQTKGLHNYLAGHSDSLTGARPTIDVLRDILGDCLVGQQADVSDAQQWVQTPVFKCTCSLERVWRSLSLLPPSDVQHIIADQKNVEVVCDFCNHKYCVSPQEVSSRLLATAKPVADTTSDLIGSS